MKKILIFVDDLQKRLSEIENKKGGLR